MNKRKKYNFSRPKATCCHLFTWDANIPTFYLAKCTNARVRCMSHTVPFQISSFFYLALKLSFMLMRNINVKKVKIFFSILSHRRFSIYIFFYQELTLKKWMQEQKIQIILIIFFSISLVRAHGYSNGSKNIRSWTAMEKCITLHLTQ